MKDKQCIHLKRYFETDLFETADFIHGERCARCSEGMGYDPKCDSYMTDQELGDLLMRGFYGGDSE